MVHLDLPYFIGVIGVQVIYSDSEGGALPLPDRHVVHGFGEGGISAAHGHSWDEEQGGRRGEDDPAGGVVHLEAAVSQLLGLLLLPLLPSSVLNSEQV